MRHINPSTEEVMDFEETPLSEIPGMCALAKSNQKSWAATSLAERLRLLKGHKTALVEAKDSLALAISTDMGKPLDKAMLEVSRTVDAAEHLFANAEQWLQPETRDCGKIFFDPLGLAAAITPWNAPLVIPMFQILPSLLAGNVVIWKPSEIAPRISAMYFSILQTMLPTNVLQCVMGAKEHGKTLLDFPFEFLSFTGSTETGRWIAQKTAANFTRLQLELGGVDAAIVLADVDVAMTAESIVKINASNSGQICCSIKRVYVERQIFREFLQAAEAASKKVSLGDPLTNPDMGPLSSAMQLEKCQSFLADAVSKGARVISGGKRRPGNGYFFEHTLVGDLAADSRLLVEEAFGPILPVLPVETAESAVDLANALPYGLSASIWGQDESRLNSISRHLQCGIVGLNRHGVPPLGCPWGGAKHSGLGRSRSKEGFIENCNLKFVM